jgi:dihydrofolate synthase/folylpolyglutamate synthase
MTPELALSYLASLNESRIKPGFERIEEALERLGNPQEHYPNILVAGTNGKGSVVAMLCNCLIASGLRPGRFTSPHLHSFTERIAVGGLEVTPLELAALVKEVRDTGVELTYFEFATAMALLHFRQEKVDLAVLEVGLGGLWDATNIVDPFLSVITSVGLDHEKWLGSTVKDVASHKAPVMRKGKPVIVGPVPAEAEDVITQYASEIGANLSLFGTDFDASWEPGGQTLHFKGRMWSMDNVRPGLPGQFQLGNAACALAALENMSTGGWSITTDEAARGMADARWPGRFQWFDGKPPVLLDSAHNPAAMKALVDSLEGNGPVVWLVSALDEKDLGGMAQQMLHMGDRVVLVPLDHPRAADVEEMAGKLPDRFEVRSAISVGAGLEVARKWAGESGTVVAAGSVFLAAKVLEILGIQEPGEDQEP